MVMVGHWTFYTLDCKPPILEVVYSIIDCIAIDHNDAKSDEVYQPRNLLPKITMMRNQMKVYQPRNLLPENLRCIHTVLY